MTARTRGAAPDRAGAALRLAAYLLAELTRARREADQLRAELHQLRSSLP
ncbi:hypothetical protein ACGFKZ_30085 [Micromonospora tulbaghiae]